MLICQNNTDCQLLYDVLSLLSLVKNLVILKSQNHGLLDTIKISHRFRPHYPVTANFKGQDHILAESVNFLKEQILLLFHTSHFWLESF